jgi:hypothetical protein
MEYLEIMIFNQVSIVITNVDEDSASVKVVFDPPFPENEDEIPVQPALTLLDLMLEAISDLDDDVSEEKKYLQ